MHTVFLQYLFQHYNPIWTQVNTSVSSCELLQIWLYIYFFPLVSTRPILLMLLDSITLKYKAKNIHYGGHRYAVFCTTFNLHLSWVQMSPTPLSQNNTSGQNVPNTSFTKHPWSKYPQHLFHKTSLTARSILIIRNSRTEQDVKLYPSKIADYHLWYDACSLVDVHRILGQNVLLLIFWIHEKAERIHKEGQPAQGGGA
jgi:hypothetical protein